MMQWEDYFPPEPPEEMYCPTCNGENLGCTSCGGTGLDPVKLKAHVAEQLRADCEQAEAYLSDRNLGGDDCPF